MAILGFGLACAGIGALVGVIANATSLLMLRAFANGLNACRPSRRADVIFLLGFAPALIVVSVVGATALPSIMARAGLMLDHCQFHNWLAHVCLDHVSSLPFWLVALGAVALSGEAARATRGAIAAIRSHHRLVALERLGSHECSEGFDVRSVPGAPRLLLAAGLWRRRIVYSGALADHLRRDELLAALSHEAAHLRRRDALALALLNLGGLLSGALLTRTFRDAYRAAAEEACDAAAAAEHGGETVARALVSASRLQLAFSNGLGFAGHGLSRRVSTLLAMTGRSAPPSRVLPFALALAAVSGVWVTVFGLDIHHAVEALLSFTAIAVSG